MSAPDAGGAIARARQMDGADPLRPLRERFEIPRGTDGASVAYFCGNSLGLMPAGARAAVRQELDDWATLGVEGHMEGRTPWFSYHEVFRDMGARLVGARPGEVVMMNSLTVNLHLMMVSFYRPQGSRRRILIEDDAFPSDSYAVQSQLRLHGIEPDEGLIRLKPRAGERALRTSDVTSAIRDRRDELALALLPGVSYLTGQVFDMQAISAAAREAGVAIGWDLAHAAGNIPMKLHDWGPDFACWCSYKYVNAGPGAVAGCFVHERHGRRADLPRFAGWWGNDPATRFQMKPDFAPRPGADGWQLSNPPILAMAPLKASLEIFDEVGMEALRAKSRRMTAFLADLLEGLPGVEIITPPDTETGAFDGPAGGRGCQLSIRLPGADARAIHGELKRRGVICDFREPDIIRAAPVPLYNRFEDCVRLADEIARQTA